MKSQDNAKEKRFQNLVRVGKLKEESPSQDEIDGFIASARPRLKDASNAQLSLESRFDLIYNATHSLSLAALRWQGYRSENRYIVFQCLPDTLELDNASTRILDDAHRRRNNAEYSGIVDIDEAMVKALLEIAERILKMVLSLEKIS